MQSTKFSCSRFWGCGRNGKNNIQTTGKAIQLRLHGIRFLSEHLDLLEHRATTSAGKPMSILRVKAEKIALPSFLVVCSCSLFSTCLDCAYPGSQRLSCAVSGCSLCSLLLPALLFLYCSLLLLFSRQAAPCIGLWPTRLGLQPISPDVSKKKPLVPRVDCAMNVW